MSNLQRNPPEKSVAALSETEKPMADLLKAIEAVGQTGEPYAIAMSEMIDLGLYEEVEVKGWTMHVVSSELKAAFESRGCYYSGPYLGHAEVGADDYYLVERKKAA